MNKIKQFESENFLMSVFGHLVLFAVITLSLVVVVERAKTVAPNRVEIIELDLKDVKITGDETKLQNTTVQPVETDKKTDPKDEIKQNIPDEKIELKQPTMIENETKTLTKENIGQTKPKKIESTPAPRKKTVVKVKREVLSLDRTMTVSVIDALRVALTRCWNIDTNHPDIEDIRLTAHLKMLQTGVIHKIWYESESRAKSDPAFAYVLDTVKEAIRVCQPFSMLPRKEYDKWQDITLTFYPSKGKIM